MSADRGLVLVAGGAGYVGSVLVRHLLDRGWRVRVLDSLVYGARGLDPRAELVVADIRAFPTSALDGVEAVLNLAGISNDPTAEFDPEMNRLVNFEAAVALAESAKQAGVPRYVLASSCSIYDVEDAGEKADVPAEEWMRVSPRAAYSWSKREAEKGVLVLTDNRFCPVALRKGTIYGFSPRMRYDLVVNAFVKDALSKGAMTLYRGGEMWRPVLSLADAARAYEAALVAPEHRIEGRIFNIVGQNVRISELALRVRGALVAAGEPEPRIMVGDSPGKVRSYRASGAFAAEGLGFTPESSVEREVMAMVAEIKASEGYYTDWDNPIYYNIRWLTEEASARTAP